MTQGSATGVMLVLTAPTPGVSEAEFNDWYDNVHVPEILAGVPGVVSVQRYRLAQAPSVTSLPFLAVYTIDRPSEEVMASFAAAGLSMSEVLDTSSSPPQTLVYDNLGPRQERAQGQV